MKIYHIPTETQYSSFKAAKDAFGILGLNADNCGQYGFVIPTDEPRPEITATQKATKAGKPTENPDGSWSYKWTVRDKTPEEIEVETQNKRQGITVPRDDFAAAVMVSGIISPQEAQDWASGNALPAAVETALVSGITDPTQLAIAKIKALSSANIGRTNPLIDMLAATFEMTPEEVDTLFETAKQIGKHP